MSTQVKEYLDLSKEDLELAEKTVTALDLKRFELELRDDLAKDGAELVKGLGELSKRIETLSGRLDALETLTPISPEASTFKVEGEVS